MVAVPLGVSTFHRTMAETPEILLTNLYLEKDATNLIDGLVRIQRPGLSNLTSVAEGPVRGIYQQAGTFGGKFFAVSGITPKLIDSIGNQTNITGTVPGSTRVIMAASATRLLIATGANLYSTDGTTITQVIAPDDIPFSSVEYINGYFLAAQAEAQRIYYLAPGDTDFDPLSFFSAENSADNVVATKKIGDEIWLFGEAGIEVWVPTGEANAPFSRVSGRLYTKGCANRDTVVALDNTLFWVGNDKIVYRADSVPQRISDNGIEERLRKSDAAAYVAWAFSLDGHLFYVLTIGTEGTFAYDVSTQTWSRFQTYEREVWQAHVGTQSSGSLIVAGDDTTGDIWKLVPGQSNDNGQPMVRELVGGVPIIGRPQICRNFTMSVASGNIDPNLAPQVMFRTSDDGGNIWSNWDFIPLGRAGEYSAGIVNVWGLGMMRPPGHIFHIRMTDDVLFRISWARINEAFAA